MEGSCPLCLPHIHLWHQICWHSWPLTCAILQTLPDLVCPTSARNWWPVPADRAAWASSWSIASLCSCGWSFDSARLCLSALTHWRRSVSLTDPDVLLPCGIASFGLFWLHLYLCSILTWCFWSQWLSLACCVKLSFGCWLRLGWSKVLKSFGFVLPQPFM